MFLADLLETQLLRFLKGNIMENNENVYEIARKSCVICNSCRYCEGLCAVFPAMERKREFSLQDIDYLANLCHQCSECFYDCQYAPPHEFNLALPKQLAKVRAQSYTNHAFPSFLGKAFGANAIVTTIVLVIALFLGFFASGTITATEPSRAGDFFAYVPESYMIGTFSVVAILVLAALFMSCKNFANAIELKDVNAAAIIQSIKDALKMRYLGGHEGEGCTYPTELRSNVRRVFHHFTMYGFIFCFIATVLGAIYLHILNIPAPYDFTQLPKIFGVIGGIALCIGVAGLFALKLKADKNIVDENSVSMDYALLAMLFIVSFGGLVLMCLKESAYLPCLLYFHLSTVFALFVMIPYSKFIHVFYRFIALVKYNMDEQEA